MACVVAAVAMAACAQEYPPTGGEPDRDPPYVVSTEPEAMAIVPEWKGPVVIRFNERISERGIEEAVTVSPETSGVRVKKGRREIRVSLEDGWERGRIYRIVVHPVVRDLFGNVRPEPFEVVFSTGAPIPATALAGLVLDRITGKPVRDVRVEAVHRMDSVTYVATTDTVGLFAMRFIPSGAYDVRAFVDQIPNRRVDFTEPFDSAAVLMSATDTAVVQLSLLPGDTTAARVTGASAPDSTHLKIRLDDYLDPEVPLDGVRVELFELPDSTFAGTAEAMHVHEFEALLERLKAAADSTTVGDAPAATDDAPAVVDGDPTDADDDPAAPEDVPADTAVPLPTREFIAVPESPLPPETGFVVRVEGIRNIHGLDGGGGSAEFTTPKRPAPPDTVPPDSIHPDSLPAGMRPDTLGAGAPDSILPGTRPDSPRVRPDPVPPRKRPDSTGVSLSGTLLRRR